MKKFLNIFFLILFIFLNSSVFSQNIATINLEFIYSQSTTYSNFINEVNNFKKLNEADISKTEKKLILDKEEIEDLRSIISQEEIALLTNEYNQSLEILLKKVEKINLIINRNIGNNKDLLKKNIIIISQEIANNNNIDIIFSENDYFISSKSVDISSEIIKNINAMEINLLFEKF